MTIHTCKEITSYTSSNFISKGNTHQWPLAKSLVRYGHNSIVVFVVREVRRLIQLSTINISRILILDKKFKKLYAFNLWVSFMIHPCGYGSHISWRIFIVIYYSQFCFHENWWDGDMLMVMKKYWNQAELCLALAMMTTLLRFLLV